MLSLSFSLSLFVAFHMDTDSDLHNVSGTTTCESNGQFSSVTCTKIHCTDVTIAHATPSPVTGESFTTYDVTCDEGYHVNGQSQNDRVQSATCQSTGQFTVLQNCVANTCGSFSHANSDQSSPVSGLTTGDQLSVTCNTGYTSDGTVTIQTATCQTNGMFNTLNSCNANTCGSFSHANSDQSSLISGLTTGDQLSVSCNTGYTSDGTVTAPQTAICQADGTFNTLNSCNANTCTSQAVLNAVGTPFTGHTTAEVVTVVCEDGYYGGGDMTCSTLGSFESVPTCNQILCTPPIVLYGTYHDSSWNDVADGIYPPPPPPPLSLSRSCESNSLFRIQLTTPTHNSGTTLNLLNVNCSEGFSKSNVSISCGCSANGQPCDSLTTVCYSNGCSPPSVNNGHYNILEWGDPKSNGQELNSSRIICDAGYRRTAELNFVCGCLEDGASCEAITNACEEKMCPELNVNSGALTATCTEVGATSGTTCIFACSAGYSMSGTNPVPCELSGSWGTPYPSCTENMCEEIFVSRSGSTAGANCSEAAAIDNPVCEFSCSAGYNLIGDENVHCNLDGNWGPYPTCEAQSCNAIEIENSDFSNSIVGNTDDIHVVTCQNGYTENDQSRIQTLKCDGNTMTFRRVLTDGSLANVLQCVANDCTPTFHLNSDKSVAGSIVGTTGEIVTVTCNPGYTNDGNTITMNTTCDGQSFSALDTCVPNTPTHVSQQVSRIRLISSRITQSTEVLEIHLMWYVCRDTLEVVRQLATLMGCLMC